MAGKIEFALVLGYLFLTHGGQMTYPGYIICSTQPAAAFSTHHDTQKILFFMMFLEVYKPDPN